MISEARHIALEIVAVLRECGELDEDQMLTVRDCQERLQCGREVVLGMLQTQRIPGVRIGRQWRVSRQGLRRAMNAGFPLPNGRVKR